MVCIADLGLAIKDYDIKCTSEKCGTPGYVDPDVLNGSSFSSKSDIFSLGSLLYNVATCRFLFGGTTAKAILHKNKHQDPSAIIDKYCTNVSL
jgi:serine/threonine protein kinase